MRSNQNQQQQKQKRYEGKNEKTLDTNDLLIETRLSKQFVMKGALTGFFSQADFSVLVLSLS